MKKISTFLETLGSAWTYRDGPEQMHQLAVYYWRALLAIAALLICVAFAWGGWALVRGLSGEADALLVGAGNGSKLLDTTSLKTILKTYETRRINYDSLNAARLDVEDPARVR